jgi:hypothetical protein
VHHESLRNVMPGPGHERGVKGIAKQPFDVLCHMAGSYLENELQS